MRSHFPFDEQLAKLEKQEKMEPNKKPAPSSTARVQQHTNKDPLRLGLLYFDQQNPYHSYRKARYWLGLAAMQNRVEAYYHLGLIYLNGYDIEKNAKSAIYWFHRAAQQNHLESQQQLEKFLDPSEAPATRFLAALVLKKPELIILLLRHDDFIKFCFAFFEILTKSTWAATETERQNYLRCLDECFRYPFIIDQLLNYANTAYQTTLSSTHSRKSAFQAALRWYRPILNNLAAHNKDAWELYLNRHALALKETKLSALLTDKHLKTNFWSSNRSLQKKYSHAQKKMQEAIRTETHRTSMPS
ncbi:MAG: hypothetical protein A3E83_02475 [Gammaproteobacteria bacterium RIFCSPHIGHO2_12_FULL_41_20]|nr:MAG: hypothetical protein A3E83_02475 [Gammaproteobacteria bacterium RIFCSPHIGHO2_12_FULL_41_20]